MEGRRRRVGIVKMWRKKVRGGGIYTVYSELITKNTVQIFVSFAEP